MQLCMQIFPENYTLKPNDEIQAVHFSQTQVTLHPMYLICHSEDSTMENPKLTKEAIIMISDDLNHGADAVYNFTMKLFHHMQSHPEKVGLPKVLHRITDNCSSEYKSRFTFSHMYEYEEVMGVKVYYHFSEPGHGKGVHDGIGATVKSKLDNLILHDKVILNNAYQVYLTAAAHLTKDNTNDVNDDYFSR